jgi:hypothetical protein
MAELTVSNLPLSENFRQQQGGNTPYGTSEQDAWPLTSPVDFIATTGPCAQTLLGTIPYNTKTEVDLIRICKGSAGEYPILAYSYGRTAILVWVLCLLLNVPSAIYHDCAEDEDLVSRFQPVRAQKSLSIATFSNWPNRSNRGTEEFNSMSCRLHLSHRRGIRTITYHLIQTQLHQARFEPTNTNVHDQAIIGLSS